MKPQSSYIANESDENEFARALCERLAQRLQGTLSVGLSLLVAGAKQLPAFLDDQFEVLDALAIVLRTWSGKPFETQVILESRKIASEIRRELGTLRQNILAGNQTLSAKGFGPFGNARQSSARICESIESFAKLLNISVPSVIGVKAVAEQIFDACEEPMPDSNLQPAANR